MVIDDKSLSNQVLILTFYFLLLGNNAAAVWESSIISGTMDSLRCEAEIPITSSHLYAIILTEFWCYFSLLVQGS